MNTNQQPIRAMNTKQLYEAEKAMQLDAFNQRNKEASDATPCSASHFETAHGVKKRVFEDVCDITALVDALEDLLPWHTMACCVRDDTGWVMENNRAVVTEESCQCSAKIRNQRKLLAAYRQSRKGFSPQNDQNPATGSKGNAHE